MIVRPARKEDFPVMVSVPLSLFSYAPLDKARRAR